MATPVIDEFARGREPETISEFALFSLESIAQPCQGNHCEVAGYHLSFHANISGIIGDYYPASNPFLVSKLVA